MESKRRLAIQSYEEGRRAWLNQQVAKGRIAESVRMLKEAQELFQTLPVEFRGTNPFN